MTHYTNFSIYIRIVSQTSYLCNLIKKKAVKKRIFLQLSFKGIGKKMKNGQTEQSGLRFFYIPFLLF